MTNSKKIFGLVFTSAFTGLVATSAWSNVVENGSFEGSHIPWQSYAAFPESTAFMIPSRHDDMRISISGDVPNATDAQVFQSGLKLEEGATYTLTFTATTCGHITWGRLEVLIGEDATTGIVYMSPETFDLDPMTRKFTVTFTMFDATDENARLSFRFGGQEFLGNGGYGYSFAVDDVELTKVD